MQRLHLKIQGSIGGWRSIGCLLALAISCCINPGALAQGDLPIPYQLRSQQESYLKVVLPRPAAVTNTKTGKTAKASPTCQSKKSNAEPENTENESVLKKVTNLFTKFFKREKKLPPCEPPNPYTLDIQVTGIADKEAANNVKERLNEHIHHFEPKSPEKFREFHQEAPAEIKKALEPFGYFEPKISGQLWHEAYRWHAVYQVDPGPVVMLKRFHFQLKGEGICDPKFLKLIQKFPLKVHEPFSAVKYNKIKEDLASLATERGYFTARFTKNVIYIDIAKRSAKIVLLYDTGPRYRFGSIHFSRTPFVKSFLKRFAPFKPGDYYSQNKIQKFQHNLMQANYFSQVSVSAETDNTKKQHVPVDVTLAMDKSRRYSAGVGYGTDTGLRGLLGVEYRYLNKYGHHFDASARVAQKQTTVEAIYHIPGWHPATDELQIGAGYREERVANDNIGKPAEIWVGYESRIKGWDQNIALEAIYERYQLRGVQYPAAAMLLPNANWFRKVSDNELRPTKGYTLDITIEGTAKPLSTVSFFQAGFDFKTIHTFKDSFRLILRGSLGYTFINDNNDLPFSLQYFAGGFQSIRGYSYKSIGPERALTIGSIELQKKLKGNWFAAVFFDAGNVGDKLFNTFYNKGVGAGIVWLSPIGAIQAGIAKPLNTPNNGIQFVFSMGPEL